MIYLLRCKSHHTAVYIGSAKNLKARWANHKSDTNLKKTKKCQVAHHVCASPHHGGTDLACLEIFAIDAVNDEKQLGPREMWWQCNVGTLFVGLNSRKDFQSMLLYKNRILF